MKQFNSIASSQPPAVTGSWLLVVVEEKVFTTASHFLAVFLITGNKKNVSGEMF
jgi:hypothetical protein